MKRIISICSGQFGDMPLEELLKTMHDIGYEALEVATHAHIDVRRILNDEAYYKEFTGLFERYDMKISAISAHLIGQCVADRYDSRLDNFAPADCKGNPDKIRAWAIEEMKNVAYAAQKLGVKVVTFFTGSPIWAFWYSYPQTTPQMVEDGFQTVKELWTPIFDVFDACGVKLALEVHPSEIAFDYYTTKRLLDTFGWRETLGINFDPSHLQWQQIDPSVFLRDFASRIYNVHMKDVKTHFDGRAGILGSHIDFGDTRRAWNFVSLGHGDVDFDGIIRELNQMGYHGPLSIEWEDSGMDRIFGAREAYEFCSQINFEPSAISFDSALKKD